jgi:hypothetical protein
MVAYSSCKPCGCNFPVYLLAQHKKGKQHLRNVAAVGISTPNQPPPPSSNLPKSQPASLPSASAPAITVPIQITSDPRVVVSHEGGLDFEVEGTEVAEQLPFPPVHLAILIEKTEVVSSLSISAVNLFLSSGTPNSWCDLFGDSI